MKMETKCIVNNFEILSKYFDKLRDSQDFFFIQVLQRRKDGHDKAEHIIKNFYIYDKQSFLEKENHIIKLCKENNARAYFWVNPRNSRKIALECIKSYADLITQGDCSKGYKVWDKKCGVNPSNNYDKLWIVDIDTKDNSKIALITQIVNKCRGKYDDKIRCIIPTKNGIHLITTGFDTHQFRQLCIINKIEPIDIHKDRSTLLYYAEN